jgi:hypothetical protein
MTWKDLRLLNAVQRVELLSLLGFLYETAKLPHKSMVPTFRVWSWRGRQTMAGPGDTLKHLSFAEFMMAEGKLENWERTGDPAMLDQLCGVLYRPQDRMRRKEADQRIPYSEGTVPYYGKIFTSVSAGFKHAILMNYFGATQYLPRMYVNIFPGPEKNENPDQPPVKPAKKSVSLSWLNMLFRTAGWDMAKIKEMERTSMHTVLYGLNDMIQANKK